MDLTFILGQAGEAWTRAKAFMADFPEIAGIGLGVAAIAALVFAVMAVMALVRVMMMTRRTAIAGSIRGMRDAGVRIVVARGYGGRRGAITRFLHSAAETHLAGFMFGGPFRVIRYPGALGSELEARKLLARSEADLVMWSERTRGAKSAAHILSRPGSKFEPDRTAAKFAMPKERNAWTPALSRAMAYAAARQFRPALGRPQDFRAERLQPVVEALLAILADKPKADPRLLAEMVDDAASGALQLAFAGNEAWLEQSVEIAQATLNGINRGASPDRWIAAKINMGRALRLRAEKRFDPVVLRESIAHLTDALDALRAEPRFKLAESAAQGIGEAQKLLGARRKFSISGGGI